MSGDGRINERIDQFLEMDLLDQFVDVNLDDSVSDKLFSYQLAHVCSLICCYNSGESTIVDGSDTGTGKTYTAMAVCKQLNLKPFIICPKSIIHSWYRAADYFEVEPLSVVNYDTVRTGQDYTDRRSIGRKMCEYLDYNQYQKKYTWNLPIRSVIIFDEVHKCKNERTLNGKLLMSTKGLKTLMLSATIADTPDCFRVFGYVLGFYKEMRQARNWVRGTKAINRYIYPAKGSRMIISDLGDKFPENQVTANCYHIDKKVADQVNKNFRNIGKNFKLCHFSKDPQERGQLLAQITAMRQEIELIKAPIMVEQAKEYLESGHSVAIFVNFRDTMDKIVQEIGPDNCSVVHGSYTLETRNQNIDRFQSNEIRVIVCISQAGGVGISLHDEHGGHPRVSLISPSFSSIDLIQVLGRIHRAGGKTPALQRIVFCANTCEEYICQRVQDKSIFIDKINNRDLVQF